jgi:putative ABC transport system ATP-binding protein
VYELQQVSKLYRQGPATIRSVDGVDLNIGEGEFVVVEGASGSGKSTLLQLLGGLDRPTSGRLTFEGQDLATMPDRRLADLRLRAFGFVFQQFNLIPTLTAAENVEAVLAPAGEKKARRRARVGELLDMVGLGKRAGHLPTQLSGGEQQRVAIARALANRPRVLLADEPTGNLDSTTGATILDLLGELWSSHGQTIVLVTHDARVASGAPRVLTMRDGQLSDRAADWGGPTSPERTAGKEPLATL